MKKNLAMGILVSFRSVIRITRGHTKLFHFRKEGIFTSAHNMSAENFCVRSPEPELRPAPFQTLPSYLLSKCKEFSDKGISNYVIDAISKEKRNFDQFDHESRKIASALYKAGLRKNGFVIYMPSEIIKLHIFLTGVWRSNGVCRASYPDDDKETLEDRIKEINCKIILCDANRVELCQQAAKNVGWPVEIITTTKHPECRSIDDLLESEDGASCPELAISGDDPALILCTSGTTGPSKGAVLNHSTLVQHLHYLTHMPYAERNMMFSTATHYSGSLFTLSVLASGKSSIVTPRVSQEILCETVAELKPGTAFAFPTFLLQLVAPTEKKYDFSSLEVLMTGGAMVTPAINQALRQRLPNVKEVINFYGLSETGVIITNVILNPDKKGTLAYEGLPDFAAGKPYPNTTIQIRDVETLKPLGPNEKGEICIYNQVLFHSYFNRPEATKESFVDGYLRSGDIGYYDEQGFIYIVDRLKEIFKYYNNHISPSEVENVIGQHPAVDEVCVIGVPDPSPAPGPGGDQVPRAFITLKGDKTPGIIDEITNYAHSKLASYKHLRGGLYIVPELPKGKTGKVTRNLVAQMKV